MFLLVSGGHIGVPERDSNMAFPYKALLIWVKRFSEYLAYEILHRPDSWQGFCILTFFHFPDSRLCVLNGLHLYFWWRDSENRELRRVSFERLLRPSNNISHGKKSQQIVKRLKGSEAGYLNKAIINLSQGRFYLQLYLPFPSRVKSLQRHQHYFLLPVALPSHSEGL